MSFDLIDNGWRKLLKTGQIGYDNKKTVSILNLGESELQLSLEQIIGAKVDLELPEDGCYFLQTPKRIPNESFVRAFEYRGDMFVISYTDFDGMLTKHGFGFSGFEVGCATFELNYPEYNMVAYIPEETNDTIGLGITLQPGWYAVNYKTFAFETFDLANNPFIVDAETFDNLEKYEDKEVVAFIRENLFVKKYSHSFIVSEKNVAISSDDGGERSLVISYADIHSGVGSTDETWVIASILVGDDSDGDGLFDIRRSPYQDAHGKITYVDSITTIHPKYLPEEARPKIVNMREFAIGYGTDATFNDAILQLVQISMQKGGVWIVASLIDCELALSKALSKSHNPIMYVYEPSQQGECYVPLATILVGGGCNVASASVPCFMASIPITLDIMIVWTIGGVDEEVDIYVRAAPFTATPVGD